MVLSAPWVDPGPVQAPRWPGCRSPSDQRVSLSSIREIAQSHRDVEQELAHAVNASSKSMDRVYGKPRAAEVPALFPSCSPSLTQPSGRLHGVCSGSSQGLSCSFVLDMVNNVRALRSETELLLAGKLALVSGGRLAARTEAARPSPGSWP